jgi:CheY-like chemotaxis protein/HPt (histidine-containing phosphotransfer) domain-containing protein
VVGDPHRLQQILSNLVSNALKFTPKGEVRTRVGVAQPHPTRLKVRFDVVDTGIGISQKAQSRLFRPFTQADGSITRTHGGTGLGLSICKLLVQLLGGEIGFQSELDRGSTFWFTAQLRRDAQGHFEMDATLEPEPLNIKAHILVAEDNPINQKVVCALVESLGCTTRLAKNGIEALEVFQSEPFDLVLMDCQMPELSGFDATRRIRDLDAGREIPIVAMTAQALAGDRERCLAAGMDDHISKPTTREGLQAVLRRWLELRVSEVSPPSSAPDSEPRLGRWDSPQPPVDFQLLSQLEEQTGDPELIRDLVRAFIEDLPQELEELSNDWDRRDGRALAGRVHRLRSSALNLGAGVLGDLCRRIEISVGSGRMEGADPLVTALESELHRVATSFRAYLAS